MLMYPLTMMGRLKRLPETAKLGYVIRDNGIELMNDRMI